MSLSRDPKKYKKDFTSTISLDDGRVLACEKDLANLNKLGLDTLEGAMAFVGDDVARDAGSRVTYRVEIEGEVWFVKVHKKAPLRSRFALAGQWVVSPGHREWDSANMLRRNGFDVPQPVAFGESINFFSCPRQSFVITREIKGPTLEELLLDGYPAVEGKTTRQVSLEILDDMAGMIKRFHVSGYYHKDLYCCHLIVAVDEHESEKRWGQPHFIDLERVVRERKPHSRWLVKDLAALNFSAPATVTTTDRWRFLKQYLPSYSVSGRKKWARAIIAKTQKIASHIPKYL
jgi:tRNA A-37 threonylcarbamoyl transferase component Bud32